jgi:hypothetical protein
VVTQSELDYYATPGEMTELGDLGDGTPSTVPELCRVVQGLLVHPFWTQGYGVAADQDEVVRLQIERQDELQLRPARKILEKALELDGSPLTEERPPERRVLGNCRDFSTVTTALLRHHGVPARARCGFGLYFAPDRYVDHWIVEWWDGTRWVSTDAQLDAFQQKWLNLPFDPLDMPPGHFVNGGNAWRIYRRGEATPDRFGVLDLSGIEFIRGNLEKDIASLNKVEMLAWDGWDSDSLDDQTMDELATISVEADFGRAREVYENDERLRVPDEISVFFPEEHRVRIR